MQKPGVFQFDPDGRIWVVEYQGYMRDVKGSGEAEPICRVVVLEDTDHDGRADKSTVFLDRLVMPRSFAFVKGGVLLQEPPPKLWFCEDTDGDLRSDRRTEVGKFGVAGNPRHHGERPALRDRQLAAQRGRADAPPLGGRPAGRGTDGAAPDSSGCRSTRPGAS